MTSERRVLTSMMLGLALVLTVAALHGDKIPALIAGVLVGLVAFELTGRL